MDAATLAPIRSLASRLCSLSDTDATFAQLVASGRELAGAAYELARICAPGGEADRLADLLDDPDAAAQYVREIVETFAPFAAILPAVEVTAPGEQWVLGTRSGYTKVSAAEARRIEKRRREKELRKACDARFVVTYAEAARRIGVPVPTAHNYAHLGKLVAVYPNGRRKAVGVTRASLDAYIERRDLRRNAAKTRANELVARREERERTGGTFYTDRGETIVGADRITAAQAATLYGLTEKKLHTAAKRGKVARVYVDAKRNHPVGYIRATVEAFAAEREAFAAAGGIYYTAAGQIVGAERISRSEAAAALQTNERNVSALAAAGQIAHVYADPAFTIPCGYTRASVEAWAQAHPRHIPARKAQAVPDFKIAPLPPQPRKQGLRAARLDPDAADEAAGEKPAAVIEGDAPRPQRRPRPTFVFRLAAWNAATTSEEKEQTMQNENETNEQNEQTTAAATTSTAPGKLEVAKAYTVHEAGVIRAICVSEADRDEIVEALRLYRRAKAAPGDIESALQLLRAVREIVGTSGTPGTAATAEAATAATN